MQAGYGLLQYFYFFHSTSNFRIVGSYDNPAGFAACLAVSAPLSFTFFRYSLSYNIFGIISFMIISVAIVLSGSRAGIISITLASAIFLYSQLSNKKKLLKKYLIPVLFILGIALFIYLLYLKKGSATGRLLIWEITLEIIEDNPILGSGRGSFLAEYMKYQAGYFFRSTDSKYALFADNVLHPFNEYLLLLVEYGAIGFMLLSIGVIFIIKSSKFSSPYLLCLISLGVFSLFSYPLKYPFVWVLVAYSLAQISKQNVTIWSFNLQTKTWYRLLITIIVIVCFSIISQNMLFEYRWSKLAKHSLLGKTKELIPKYEYLYKNWNGNYLFLYNYGAELNHIEKYEKSITVLNKCQMFCSDYDICIIQAENYFNLKKWRKSEYYCKMASGMCPNRFIPLYKLHHIYINTKEHNKALEVAKTIVDKDVKVSSSTVYLIKEKMRKFLEQ